MDSSGAEASAQNDLFVSYAHADDEPPFTARKGWVTTLVEELAKVLRRKLGRDRPKVWMDQQLAANEKVTDALLSALHASRTLLLIMSPNYQDSQWCQRELGEFLTASAAAKNKSNVFVVEIEPVQRETWHERLRDLTAISFWTSQFDKPGTRLLGYPTPNLDEDSEYWTRVNELAHFIAEYLKRDVAKDQFLGPRPAVLLAETTREPDLMEAWVSVAATLRQRRIEVLPASGYPRDSTDAYTAALRRDLTRAVLFVQLLGLREPSDSEKPFVMLQAAEAAREQRERSLRVLKWRAAEIDPGAVPPPSYRELLCASDVHAGGIEEFKRDVLAALASPAAPSPREAAAAAAGRLCIYVNADQVDRNVADEVSDALSDLGVDAVPSPAPAPGQTPDEIRQAQLGNLQESDGVIIVYGHTPDTWVQSQFAFSRRVLAQRRGGVWGALLHAPPAGKHDPVKSPSLVTLDYRNGVDPAQLASFVATLRSPSAVAHA